MFNLVSIVTDQSTHLTGILTEAIHTPFMMDRYQSLSSVNYVFNIAKDLNSEIEFKSGGKITTRAQQVLDETESFLSKIKNMGLMKAISRKEFAGIVRPIDGGKGLDGIFKKGNSYSNALMERLI